MTMSVRTRGRASRFLRRSTIALHGGGRRRRSALAHAPSADHLLLGGATSSGRSSTRPLLLLGGARIDHLVRAELRIAVAPRILPDLARIGSSDGQLVLV